MQNAHAVTHPQVSNETAMYEATEGMYRLTCFGKKGKSRHTPSAA